MSWGRPPPARLAALGVGDELPQPLRRVRPRDVEPGAHPVKVGLAADAAVRRGDVRRALARGVDVALRGDERADVDDELAECLERGLEPRKLVGRPGEDEEVDTLFSSAAHCEHDRGGVGHISACRGSRRDMR